MSIKIMSSIFKWNCKYRKNVKEEKFRNYFKYQSPSSLVKDLFKANKNKNNKIKYMIINELTKLMKDINIKQIPENENPKK